MPIRIYAFAKELGLDNKELLDICSKAGISGKGSALASLSDEEVAKVKKALDGGKGQSEAESKPAATEQMERNQSPLDRRRSNDRPRVLDRPKKTVSRPAEPEPDQPDQVTEPVAAETTSEKPASSSDTVQETSAASAAEETSSTESQSSKRPPLDQRRHSPLGSRTGVIRNLDMRRKKPEGGASRPSGDDSRERRDRPRNTGVRVAAMPKVKQPTPGETKSEEKVIKPDLALPQDAIQKVKRHGGSALPLGEYTESAKKSKKGGREVPGPVDRVDDSNDRRRRGGKGRGGERRDEVDGGMGSIRQRRNKQAERRNALGNRYDDDNSPLRHRRRRPKTTVTNTAAPRKEKAVLQLPCTVREFSEVAGVSAAQVLKLLMIDFQLGMSVNINSMLDEETVELLVTQLDADVEVRPAQSLEEEVLSQFETEDDPDSLAFRPPIVTFLGHVDHGKTSLLDAIIGINVVSGEAGGITQHIRAYTVDRDDRKVSFVDTPGHEAFTEMRARGANVTDIAVLVVAADDGIMPQTEEAISHAKAAGVPIIVAMNKIDLPGANPDKVMQELATYELMPSQWGGDVEVVQTSATEGTGIDELLETILTTAELYEYKANPDRPAIGTCLESEQDPDRGVIAKIMVQNGTLKVGDVVLCGAAHGRVKAMFDTLRPSQRHQEAGPSVPVNITGLDLAPGAGEKLFVVEDIASARQIAADRESQTRDQSLSGITKRVSLEEFQQRLEAGDLAGTEKEVITLNLVLRADARGSIEAIQKELSKLDHPEVRIRILQALVGGISVGDVRLAQASDAVILGFNVVPDEAARSLADELQVEIRRYEVIYKVADDIKATLEGKLKPEEQEIEMGAVMVLRTFNISRMGTIAGCRVMRGSVQRNCRVRLIRDSRIIGDYAIDSLKREKDDAKEVSKGMECGIKLVGYNDVKEGDMLEAYRIEEVARTL